MIRYSKQPLSQLLMVLNNEQEIAAAVLKQEAEDPGRSLPSRK
jgi:hypothetical protein